MDSIASLGFHPGFLDTMTCSIYLSGARETGAIRRARSTTLIPGFVRNGFFYTRRAATRAAAEWSAPAMQGRP